MSTSFLFTKKQVDSDYANAKSQLSILLRVVARTEPLRGIVQDNPAAIFYS